MKTTKIYTATKTNTNNKIERIYFKVDSDVDFKTVKDIQKDYDKGVYFEITKKPVRVYKKDLPKVAIIKTLDDYYLF